MANFPDGLRSFDETLWTKEPSLRNLGVFVVGVKVGSAAFIWCSLALSMIVGLESV
jgi:hypothetical protein